MSAPTQRENDLTEVRVGGVPICFPKDATINLTLNLTINGGDSSNGVLNGFTVEKQSGGGKLNLALGQAQSSPIGQVTVKRQEKEEEEEEEKTPIKLDVRYEDDDVEMEKSSDNEVEIVAEVPAARGSTCRDNLSVSTIKTESEGTGQVKREPEESPPPFGSELTDLLESARWLHELRKNSSLSECRICSSFLDHHSLNGIDAHVQSAHGINVLQYSSFFFETDGSSTSADCSFNWCGVCRSDARKRIFVCRSTAGLRYHLSSRHGMSIERHGELYGSCSVSSFIECPLCRVKMVHKTQQIARHASQVHNITLARLIQSVKEKLIANNSNPNLTRPNEGNEMADTKPLRIPLERISLLPQKVFPTNFLSVAMREDPLDNLNNNAAKSSVSLVEVLQSAKWLEKKLKTKKVNVRECLLCQHVFVKVDVSGMNQHLEERHGINLVQYAAFFLDCSTSADCCVFFCRWCHRDEARTGFVAKSETGLAYHTQKWHPGKGERRSKTESHVVKSFITCPFCQVAILHGRAAIVVHATKVHNLSMACFLQKAKEQIVEAASLEPPGADKEKSRELLRNHTEEEESRVQPGQSHDSTAAAAASLGLGPAVTVRGSSPTRVGRRQPELDAVVKKQGKGKLWHSKCTYACNKCPFNTHVLDRLRHHLKRVHQTGLAVGDKEKMRVDQQYIRCSGCGQEMLHDYYDLRNHRDQKHPECADTDSFRKTLFGQFGENGN